MWCLKRRRFITGFPEGSPVPHHISVCNLPYTYDAFAVRRKTHDDAAAAVLKVRLEAVCSDKVQQMSAALRPIVALRPPVSF